MSNEYGSDKTTSPIVLFSIVKKYVVRTLPILVVLPFDIKPCFVRLPFFFMYIKPFFGRIPRGDITGGLGWIWRVYRLFFFFTCLCVVVFLALIVVGVLRIHSQLLLLRGGRVEIFGRVFGLFFFHVKNFVTHSESFFFFPSRR